MSCSRRQFIIYSGALAAVGDSESYSSEYNENRRGSLRHDPR